MSERISIVIPAYQAGAFIADTLDSILSQTHRNWECRIVDDGSTDNTAEAVRPYLDDPRITLKRQQNQGVSVARNRALASCSGEYVSFFDADDLMKPDRLARCAAAMRARPDVDVFIHRVEYVNAEGQRLRSVWNHAISGGWKMRDEIEFQEHPLEVLLLGRSFPPCAAMLRMESVRAVGPFDPSLHGTEDSDLWIRLAARGARFMRVPYVGSAYRRHPAGANLDIEKVRINQLRLIDKTFKETLRGHPLAAREPVCRAVLGLKLARKLHRERRWAEYADCIAKACQQLDQFPLSELEQRVIARMALMVPGSHGLLKTVGAGWLYRQANHAIGFLKGRERGS